MARRKNAINEPLDGLKSIVNNQTELSAAVDMFLNDCRIRNLSEHTLKYYRNELRMATAYLVEGVGINDAAQITAQDIRQHVILRMMDDGKKATSINSRLRAVRAFFNYLHQQSIIGRNPVDELKTIKEPKNVIETFSTEQIAVLLRAPDRRTFTGVRDYTIMMLMLETGVRLKELCGIRMHHVTDTYIRITEAKGAKERNVPIQTTMRHQLNAYMAQRGELETNMLFVNIDNEPISKRQIQNFIAKYGTAAGIKNVRCSPHTFRHTFAKLAVMNGANVFELQAMLGHTSLEMVRRYVHLFSQDVARGHAKFSPIENLNM